MGGRQQDHTVVDGVAGIDLMSVVLDLEARTCTDDARTTGSRSPSRQRCSWRSTAPSTSSPARASNCGQRGGRSMPHYARSAGAGRSPGCCRTDRRCDPRAATLARRADRPAPPVDLRRRQPRRRPHDPPRLQRHGERRRARRGLGGFRDLVLARGEVDQVALRTLVPVSVARQATASSTTRCRRSSSTCPSTSRTRSDSSPPSTSRWTVEEWHEAEAGQALTQLAGAVPPTFMAQGRAWCTSSWCRGSRSGR